MNLHSWQQCFSHSLYQRGDWQQQLPTCQLTSHQIAVEAGVQIYQNHLLVSLTEALQATYPYTRKMIGDACFNAVAKRYIEEHPLTTGDITHYGHGLENTLGSNRYDSRGGAVYYRTRAFRVFDRSNPKSSA